MVSLCLKERTQFYEITKKLNKGDYAYRKLTIVEGTYKYDLLSKTKMIDLKLNLPSKTYLMRLLLILYKYQVTDKADRILQNIKKFSNDSFNI